MGRVSRGERTGTSRSSVAGDHALRSTGPAPRPTAVAGRVLVTVVAMVVALVAVSACSSGDDDDAADGDEPSTTTEAPETTSTTADVRAREEDAVRQARQAAADAWIDSTAPPEADPDAPVIAETYVGPMLELLVETARGLKINGWAIRYPEDSQYDLDITSIRFDEDDGQEIAFIEVCTVDDGERIVIDTGEVLDGGVNTVRATEAMRKVDGAWKLAERREDSTLEGVAQCEDE